MNNLKSELLNITGEENIHSTKDEISEYCIEGIEPKIVIFPDSKEEISEILKFATANKLTVSPRGSGTKLSYGNYPDRIDMVLSLKNLNNFIEHNEADFIATTECGVKLYDFQSHIEKKQQFLPIDPPYLNEGATLGGIIATNDNGPSRLKYGTCRELILELVAVRSDGEIIKGGAKVVKNVAGYDLPKLFVGSLGTLGIIVESTFKLFPIPSYSQTCILICMDLHDLNNLLNDLLNAEIIPTSLEICNELLSKTILGSIAHRTKDDFYTISVKIENVQSAVIDQRHIIDRLAHKNNCKLIVIGNEKEKILWENIRNYPYLSIKDEKVICKASVPINNVLKVFYSLKEISDNIGVEINASARAGNGILLITIHGSIKNLIFATNLLRSQINSYEGNVEILSLPEQTRKELEVLGSIGPSIKVMKKIKENFDPSNILNPGRLI